MKQIDLSIDDFVNKIVKRRSHHIKYQFQLVGLQLATILGDQKNKSLYIKIAKERKDYDRLLNIANSIKEDLRVENKGAVFMAQIYRKRGNS